MGDKDGKKDGFDIDFKLLPPKLQIKLWILGLDADTGKVNIAYKSGSFVTGLAYNYGGNLEASLGVQRFTTKFGVDPGSGDMNLGLVYRGFKFGSSASITKKSYGFSIGYGASLLPYPWELASTFNAAGVGLQSIAGDIRSAPDNPLAWYKMHSDDFGAIGHAVDVGKRISEHGKGDRFGFGVRLNYTPQTHLTIYGGAIMRF